VKADSRTEKEKGGEIARKLPERNPVGEERERKKQGEIDQIGKKKQRLAADKRRGRLKRERDCMRKGSC
jgi:hypothetical protein